MEHSLPLISTLVIAFSLALVFGFIAERFLKAPALVGYLLAGIAAGKYTPGVVADAALANQLSEIGVMLLMFGVGLHFSMKDLWSVKGIAVPGAVLQMTIATALGALGAHAFFDRTWGQAIVLGISLSCASTVVLLKALDVRGKLTSGDGRIAVGWLVVEDLATVLILVILPPFASIMMPGVPGSLHRISDPQLFWVIAQTLLNAAVFVVVMLVAGRRILPWAMGQVARTGSRELFTLFVLAVAVGVAYGAAEFFHVSFALGSFFAGMVMRESRFAHRAATDSLPLQDAFAVLFFVGVGMLFDWHILIDAPLEVLAVLAIILLGKSSAAFVLVWALRYPLHTAVIVAVSLAQIGEFSFILIGQALELGLADLHLVNLVVAGAILSIALNPIGFWLEPRLCRFMTSRWRWARKAAMREAPFEALPIETDPKKLAGQAVVFGSGAAVETFARELEKTGSPVVAIVTDEHAAERLAAAEVPVLLGDSLKEETWVGAHLHRAKLLVLLESDAGSLAAAETARRVAPGVPIVVAAENSGVWPEVKLERVTFVSTLDAAARLFSAQASAAMKAGAVVGDPVTVSAKASAGADKPRKPAPEQAEVAEAADELVRETVTDLEKKAALEERREPGRMRQLADRVRGIFLRKAAPAQAPESADAPAGPAAAESPEAPESAGPAAAAQSPAAPREAEALETVRAASSEASADKPAEGSSPSKSPAETSSSGEAEPEPAAGESAPRPTEPSRS